MHDLIEKQSPRLEFLIRISDVLALYTAGILAAALRFSDSLTALPSIHLVMVYFCCALGLLLFPQFDLYSSWRGRSLWQMVNHTVIAMLFVMSAGVLFAFLIRQIDELSRSWMLLWYALAIAGIVLSRAVFYSLLWGLREHGFNQKRVVIAGYGDTGRELHKRAMEQQWTGYQVVATYDKDGAAALDERIENLKTFNDIRSAVARHQAHEVWITLPLAESHQLQQLQYLLMNELVDIRWVPDTAAMSILSHRTVEFLGMPVVELNHPASLGWHGMAKEVFDRVFALVVLILLSPLFLSLAIAIRQSSPGPVIFRQRRLGLNGRIFHVYKFRSMKVHQESEDQVTQARRDDARITDIGRFMRRTSLDELPQFLNVLMGHMSVVGPRPHALVHNDLYKDKLSRYMQRHRVKPGITGWAQINGYRGETNTEEKMARRVELDLYYIQHWSFWMDLKIILWTAFRGWTDANAY